MPILNYTTKIGPSKTIGEISQCLVRHGARKIVTDYDDQGNAIGVTFSIDLDGHPVLFALPCNWQGVLMAMEKDRAVTRAFVNKDQAIRVAWRIIKDWVEAQMAIVEAQLATTVQVFLPYAVTNTGDTFYERIAAGEKTLLLNR